MLLSGSDNFLVGFTTNFFSVSALLCFKLMQKIEICKLTMRHQGENLFKPTYKFT